MEKILSAGSTCRGNLVFDDPSALRAARSRPFLTTAKLDCPPCEMMVEPIVTSAEPQQGVAGRDAATENCGRSRRTSSNAGGRPRGHGSEEGARQGRLDPLDTKRNTWQEKP